MTNEELVSQIQAGVDVSECMSALYDQNKGLIAKEARKYPEEYSDLMQEGFFGLYEAAMHFDEAHGASASFSTYCWFWIKQVLQKYLDNSGAIRIPAGAGDMIKKYNRICREYAQEFGSEPSESTLCALLDVDQEKLHDIQKNRWYGQIQSLEEAVNEDGDEFGDQIPSDETMEEDVVRELDEQNMREELWDAVDNLPDDLSDMVRQRYLDEKTFDQIAAAHGKSPSKVRQDIRKSERLLRHDRRNKGYKSYYDEYLNVYSVHVGVKRFQRTGYSSVEEIVLNKRG